MNNTAWKTAWRKAGLPVCAEYKHGVHNLKHTFGRRLRAAGVGLETRKVLLGHRNGDITTHYSAPELQELLTASNKANAKPGKNRAVTLLRRKAGQGGSA
jgi:integrase